ncbi:MAG: DUF3566 domain-containing protein [Actinomycetota bacterium]|nr:DUF3566 domain-containing protein [Actinomycetota bacterium]
MADSDQPDQGNPPEDGVDDETFARAVGLNQQETGRRGSRRRKVSEIKPSRTSKEEWRTKDKPVVRRPPAGRKRSEPAEITEPNDETGVVPVIDKAEPSVVDTQIGRQIEPVLPITPADETPILLAEEDLGWLGRRRARVKRTRRTIRHVDPWSVLKVSVLLYACLYGATVIAGYLLWTAAVQSGVITNIESFIAEVGSYEVWEINGDEIFQRATVIGAVLFVAGVAFNVLLTIIFNLISDLVGGVRVTLLEEDQPPS